MMGIARLGFHDLKLINNYYLINTNLTLFNKKHKILFTKI